MIMDLGHNYKTGDIVAKLYCNSLFVIVDLHISIRGDIYRGELLCIKTRISGLSNYEKIPFLMFSHDFKNLYRLISV